MKYAGIKNIFTIITLFLCLLGFASQTLAQDTELYENKINELLDKGVISESDAKDQIIQLRLKNQKERSVFKEQTRGVASSLKNKKVYQINNEPIEIPSN